MYDLGMTVLGTIGLRVGPAETVLYEYTSGARISTYLDIPSASTAELRAMLLSLLAQDDSTDTYLVVSSGLAA